MKNEAESPDKIIASYVRIASQEGARISTMEMVRELRRIGTLSNEQILDEVDKFATQRLRNLNAAYGDNVNDKQKEWKSVKKGVKLAKMGLKMMQRSHGAITLLRKTHRHR